MTTLAEKASNTFNRVMHDRSINLQSTPADFTPGIKCIFVGLNDSSQDLAWRVFDELFRPAQNGIYYLYMTYDSFLATMGKENSIRSKPAKLRFYSTNKSSSIGEYCPMCIELGLDKDWRADGSGIAGHQTDWMDNIFYRSFADSPHNESERFWREFAANGTGVRLAVDIRTSSLHTDFRFVTYEGSAAVAALVEVREAFLRAGWNLRIDGFPRMPAFGQLAKYSWQREVRLIAKRYHPTDSAFPWSVSRCHHFGCNYMDCSLTPPDSDLFSLRLTDVTPGPNTDEARKKQIKELFDLYRQDPASAMPSSTSGPPSPS